MNVLRQFPYVWRLHKQWRFSRAKRVLVILEFLLPFLMLTGWFVMVNQEKSDKYQIPLYPGWPHYDDYVPGGEGAVPCAYEKEVWIAGDDMVLVEGVAEGLAKGNITVSVWDTPGEMMKIVDPGKLSWQVWREWARVAHDTQAAVHITSSTSYILYARNLKEELYESLFLCELSSAANPFMWHSVLSLQMQLEAILGNSTMHPAISLTRYLQEAEHRSEDDVFLCHIITLVVSPVSGFVALSVFALSFVATLLSMSNYLFDANRPFLRANGVSCAVYLTTYLFRSCGPRLVVAALFSFGLGELLFPHTPWTSIWLMVSLFLLALPPFCAFLSLFVRSEDTVTIVIACLTAYYAAGTAGVIVSNCNDSVTIGPSGCFTAWYVVALLPPGALTVGTGTLSRTEMLSYLPPGESAPHGPSVLAVSAILAFDILLFTSLTCWVRHVGCGTRHVASPHPGVSVRGMNVSIKGKQILHEISVSTEPGTRLALLGHNGAGKTTLLRAIVRCVDGDGEVSIHGMSPGEACSKGLVGYSPQLEVLLSELTVKEVLELACAARGVPWMEIGACAEKAAEEVGLEGVMNRGSGQLATGEKRKLSVAFAFIGNPKVVLLDEPTAGLDPHSRRQVWSLINSKKGCTVVFTTHLLDDVYLGDKVGAMNNGRLDPSHIGTVAEIKEYVEDGQLLDIVKNSTRTLNEPILDVVRKHLGTQDVVYRATGKRLSIALPTTRLGLTSHAELLAVFEDPGQCALLDVESFAVRLANLEDILLSGYTPGHGHCKASKTAVGQEVNIPLLRKDSTARCDEPLLTQPTMHLSVAKQVYTIWRHKTRTTLRSRSFYFYQFLALASLIYIIPITDFHPDGTRFAPIPLCAGTVTTVPSVVPVGGDGGEEYLEQMEALPFGSLLAGEKYTASFEDLRLNSTPFAFHVNNAKSVNIWFNATVTYSVPMAVNYVGNLLRAQSGGVFIEGSVAPFVGVPSPSKYSAYGFGLGVASSLSGMGALCAGWLLNDKISGARHLAQLSGVHDTFFYIATGLSDMFMLLISAIISQVVYSFYDEVYQQPEVFFSLLVALCVCIPGMIAANYCFAHICAKPMHANIWSVVFHYWSASEWVRGLSSNEENPGMMMPSSVGPMTASVLYFLAFGQDAQKEVIHHPTAHPLVGISGYIEMMLLHLLFWSLVLMMFESGYKLKNLVKQVFPRPDRYYINEAVHMGIDVDRSVLEEMHEVERGYGKDSESLFIRQLRKVYNNKVAVSGMYLRLRPGTCLGLISPSGAGKSTAMRMIAGVLPPSQGEIIYRNLTNLRPLQLKKMQKMVGYLPQTDPLPPNMSVECVILYHAKLKGVQGASLTAVRSLLATAEMEDYAKMQCSQLSGGLKRLVALLLALIGSPRIIILDDPTAAMDPYIRTVAWRLIGSVVDRRADPPIVILTTNSLAEVDAACTHVGVMVKGHLTIVGSTRHLKECHEPGYFITARTESDEEMALFGDHVAHAIKQVDEVVFFPKQIEFHVRGMCLTELIDILEAAKGTHNVDGYNVSSHSFEHAYLRTIQDGSQKATAKALLIENGCAPHLRICMLVVGSRGDVQPFLSMAVKLKQAGHTVQMVTHQCFEGFVTSKGIGFGSIGGDPEKLMRFMVEHPSLLTTNLEEVREKRSMMAGIFHNAWVQTTSWAPDVLVSNPPVLVHYHIAEALQIPLQVWFTMPWSPTKAYRHPLAVVSVFGNERSFDVVEELTWLGMGDVINSFREGLGLCKISQRHGAGLHRLKIPHVYCISEAIVPRPSDWAEHISISGFWFLDEQASYTPCPRLAEFLVPEGGVVVYIGFGSIVVSEIAALEKAVFGAIEQLHEANPLLRVVVTPGWANLGSSYQDNLPSHVYLLEQCPHDWLFPHCNAVVHHGGAGTTAAALRAGVPSVVVPFFGDQPFWGRCCERQGVGPTPVPFKGVTAKALTKAVMQALSPCMVAKARELSTEINSELGLEKGIAAFYKYLPFDAKGAWGVSVTENQRWFPIIGWSMTMSVGDPPAFSDETGMQQRLKEGFPCPLGWEWVGDWEVAEAADRKDGFVYATSFKGPWRDIPGPCDAVRRRTWQRKRMNTRTAAAPSKVEQLEHENRMLRMLVQSQADALQRQTWRVPDEEKPSPLLINELSQLDWDVAT